MEVCLSTLLPTPTPTHHSTTYLTSLHFSLHCCHVDRHEETCSLERHFFRHSGCQLSSLSRSLPLLRSFVLKCALLPLSLCLSLSLVLTRAWALWRVFFVKFTSSWDVYLCGCPFLRYMRLFYTYCDEAHSKANQKARRNEAKRRAEEETSVILFQCFNLNYPFRSFAHVLELKREEEEAETQTANARTNLKLTSSSTKEIRIRIHTHS